MFAIVDRVCRDCASLFVSERPSGTRQPWEIPCLIALLVLGALIRFWGVGSFGLHRPDEDTTVLAAVHILQDGEPRFPSGMFYSRAIIQSYLIAGSVKMFGQTEWALRLPSVLCGILLVALTYFVGRRFLRPVWNLTLVAIAVFLPGLIADSQEARMYGFLCASLAAFLVLVFRWERTNRGRDLAAAVVAMLLAIQFQEIAVFGSLLLLFPGLVEGNGKRFVKGLIAMIVIGVIYLVISHWNSSFHPKVAVDYAQAAPELGRAPDSSGYRVIPIVAVVVALVGALAAAVVTRGMGLGSRALCVLLLVVGLTLQATMFYHAAAVLLLVGWLLARRNGGARLPATALLLVVVGCIFTANVLILHAQGISSLRKMVGILTGQPSIWPYLRVGEYSLVGLILLVLGLIGALTKVAAKQKVNDVWLFFVLAFAIPLFGLGLFGWYFPPRYTEFALLPMLICALAACQYWCSQRAVAQVLMALVAGVLIVNPLAAAASINAGSTFPDHRGAARYMQSITLGPRDIVIAEEVLMQTYYLGHVDYWLYNGAIAAKFMEKLNGRYVDEYTHTPLIGKGSDLQALLDDPGRGAIYVVGSGEGFDDARLFLRGPELFALLKTPAFSVVYTSPDGRTQVLKVDPPGGATKN